MKKIYIYIVSIIVIIGLIVYFVGVSSKQKNVGYISSFTAPIFYLASSTAFTLTNSSSRLLATSSPTHRVAATIQPVNCTVGSAIFVKLSQDAVATANTGLAVYGSTTMELKDYPNLPIVQGSVQGITQSGTCTVLVTEWRLVQ